MIEPKSNPFGPQDAVSVRDRYGLIPSRHLPLTETRIAALSDWFDIELEGKKRGTGYFFALVAVRPHNRGAKK